MSEHTQTLFELPTDSDDILLRQFTTEDLQDAKNLFETNKDDFVRGGVWSAYDVLEKNLNDPAHDQNAVKQLGIWQGNELVGFITSAKEDESIDEVEIGYGVDAGKTKKGIASTALRALTKYEIGQGNDVIAEVDYSNKASEHVLEKAGYQLEMNGRNGRMLYRKLSMTEENLMRRLQNLM